jgi:phosphoglycerate dehydrogenase-like enzyme
MVLALIFACLRRLPALDRASRTGLPWPAEGGPAFGELGGRTVGLVGYGPVPARLAPVLKALGTAAVLYWHGQLEPGADATFVPLRELFETSDIVSLHCRPRPRRSGWSTPRPSA